MRELVVSAPAGVINFHLHPTSDPRGNITAVTAIYGSVDYFF